jgi:hypothetical protein
MGDSREPSLMPYLMPAPMHDPAAHRSKCGRSA